MGRPAKRARLLEADSDGSDAEAVPTFKINSEYAKRFEHNKAREEKQRLEEKYGKDAAALEASESSSDSEDEDDAAELATKELDAEIFETLKAIRAKDPRIYDKTSTFYKPDDPANIATAAKKSKDKPVFLQDYHRKNLLAGATDGVDGDDEQPTTYAAEQAAAKRDLLAQAQEEDDEEDDFLVAKPGQSRTSAQVATVENDEAIPEPDIIGADADPEAFLQNFMASRAWEPKATSRWQAFESEDEEENDRADEWEEAYNMRFEDPARANEKLLSHSRDAAAKYSVRREELTGRKKAREVEKSKKAARRAERDEEKARLRRLKIDEAQEKLNKFREAAGLRKGQAVSMDEWAKFLEAGFEDDNWDAEMAKRFGEDYYAEQDEEGGDEVADAEEETTATKKKSKVKKPKWDDDLDIGDIVPDFDAEEDNGNHGITLTDEEDETMADAAEDDGGVLLEEEDDGTSIKPKKHDKKSREAARLDAKRQTRKERQKIEELVDAQLAQDVPTNSKAAARFRYRETSPSAYGLSALDILMADDAQLNSYVGLKKLASFRDAEKKRKDKKRLGKKARLREWRKEAFGDAEGPKESFENFYNKQRGAIAQGTREASRVEVDGVDNAEADVVEGKRKNKRSRKRKAAEAAV